MAETPEEIEKEWFEKVYQGDRMRQLTLRAVLMGMILGMLLACSNLYIGLKAGWSLGGSITACVLAYTFFATMHKLFPRLFPEFTILENNAMQSAAAAAASLSGAGLVNAVPALIMLDPTALPTDFATRVLWITPWVVIICLLGVFLAVPTKRQLINVEKLPFPSGTAAAATMRALHEKSGEPANKAKSLGIAAGIGAIVAWWRDAAAPWLAWYPKIPATWGTSWLKIGGYKLSELTLSFEGSLLFIAAGAIISFRQAWSMLLGAIVNYGLLAPIMLNEGVIPKASFRDISRWSLWIGVPMMVTSGLLLFFMNWRAVLRAFSTLGQFFQKKSGAALAAMEKIEVPGSWFVGGFAVLGLAAIIVGHMLFHITWWMGVIAVIATFFLVVVAGRATGETDVTPVGPLSKITQLTFGAIKPGDVTVNLMTANITAGSTTAAGDLLSDLKSGYLLGANPRQQFLAQLCGVLAGGLIVVPAFFILIPNPSEMLATERWPAPAALVWKGVAELLAKGPEALHPTARIGLLVGALFGILLPLLERWFPKHVKYIPSATGLGLAFTINGFNSISFFIGSLLAHEYAKRRPKLADQYTVPVASGLIAGESLMGVAIAFLTILQILQ